MPMGIFRTLASGRKTSAADIPCYDVLTRRPNSWQSSYEYQETTVHHVALHGNAYSLIVPGQYGFCSELRPLHPSRMQVRRLSDGVLGYKYLWPEGRWQDFDQSQILHYRWLSDNSYMGMIPADLCGTSVALARKLDVAASSFWDNSARPDIVLETQETIPDPAVAELRRQWREMYGGARNRGNTAILPKKVQAKVIESNSMEANQYQDLRNSIIGECARAFGVPSTLIGDPAMARYSNVEQEFLTAQVFCLLPWQRRIEGAIDRSILNTYGLDCYAKIDNRGLLRADTAARTALYQSMFNMGSITPNEIRDLEDLPLLDDAAADKTYMQLGFAPLDVAAVANATADPEGVPPVDGVSPVADGGLVLQDTALNGAQVTALLQILASISSGTLDNQGAVSLIVSAFPSIGEPEATAIVAGAIEAPADAARSLIRSLAPAAVMPDVDDGFDLQAPLEPGEENSESDSDMSLDGDQLQGLLSILEKLSSGDLSEEAAGVAIEVAFPQISPEQIKSLVDGTTKQSQPESAAEEVNYGN
jgi:hypothetical protein